MSVTSLDSSILGALKRQDEAHLETMNHLGLEPKDGCRLELDRDASLRAFVCYHTTKEQLEQEEIFAGELKYYIVGDRELNKDPLQALKELNEWHESLHRER